MSTSTQQERLPYRKAVVSIVFLALLALPGVAEEGAPTITGAGTRCFTDVPYPVVDADIRPGEDVEMARVYFRAAQGEYFYAIEMQGLDNDFEAILPVPAPETEEVVYYVEAIDAEVESARTEEYTVEVVEEWECDERVAAAIDNPNIVIHATVEGAPAFPTGFLPTGVNVAGAVAPAAGGLGAAALAGIAAGSVGAGILVVDGLDEGSGSDQSPIDP